MNAEEHGAAERHQVVAGLVREQVGAVRVLRLDDPATRNALTDPVLACLADEMVAADLDSETRCLVLAGSDKVFASGADIRALAVRQPRDAIDGSRVRNWQRIRDVRIPTVAAVSGFCLGGGAELAMMCDVVIASETARFGLPETMLGLLPGAGGTQMLPRAVGKALAMDMVLTGRVLSSPEGLQAGLVSRVAEGDSWLDLAMDVATTIADRPSVAQRLAKNAVQQAYEVGLSAGLSHERSAFAVAFGEPDAREGIAAFLEKRKPDWRRA